MTYKLFVPIGEMMVRCNNCTDKLSYNFEPTNNRENFSTHCVICGEPLTLPDKIKGR